MAENKADRHNDGKPQLSYILEFANAIKSAAAVFVFGAIKYARGNWKKGMPREEVIDSLLRHLTAYQNGELNDPESGLPHVGHIMANALFLAEFEQRGDYAEKAKIARSIESIARLEENKTPRSCHTCISFSSLTETFGPIPVPCLGCHNHSNYKAKP